MKRWRGVRSVVGAAALVMAAGAWGPGASGAPSRSRGGTRSADDHVEFRGTIESVDAPELTVSGRRVRTSASTRILDDRNNPISLANLRAGLFVEVEGHARGDGSVAARKVKIED
jgi:hypothetical protein